MHLYFIYCIINMYYSLINDPPDMLSQISLMRNTIVIYYHYIINS